MNPWLRTSCSSPRIETTSRSRVVTSSPHVASQKGQVRWWTRVSMPGRDLTYRLYVGSIPELDPERSRDAEHPPAHVEQRRGGVKLPAVRAERPRHDRVQLADPHRVAQPGRQASEHHGRPALEVRHRRARGAVERRPDAFGPHVPVAGADRLVGRPRGGEDAVAQWPREYA